MWITIIGYLLQEMCDLKVRENSHVIEALYLSEEVTGRRSKYSSQRTVEDSRLSMLASEQQYPQAFCTREIQTLSYVQIILL